MSLSACNEEMKRNDNELEIMKTSVVMLQGDFGDGSILLVYYLHYKVCLPHGMGVWKVMEQQHQCLATFVRDQTKPAYTTVMLSENVSGQFASAEARPGSTITAA